LVYEARGSVTAEARALFERARAADPNDFRARFYLGLARQQGGDPRAALQEWADMMALAPSDAPWLAMVRARFEATAIDAGIDPATVQPSEAARLDAATRRDAAPPAAAAPSGDGAAAIAALPPAERERAIRAMVESLAARLESQPDDLEGWRRLGRAWLVIGEAARGREAFARAAALAPQRADVLADYAQTWSNELGEGRPLPPEFVAVMRRILAIEADHADALWFVGLAEAAAGNNARAIELWERLLQRLPANSPEGREVRTRLERLRAPR
ncbi:MAG: tetratricopeptide repeat protein, partial [Alphaproteobacteria bacterium]|nr:tetratricopeptide repeat protein [Alphaproteobacteria bacterium]